MKNIFKFLMISLSFLILNFETVQAATATGNADVYKVTMRKIESTGGCAFLVHFTKLPLILT